MRPNGFRLPTLPLAMPGNFKAQFTGSRLVEYRDFGANPGALRMFLHVPAGLPKGAPLVVILHGCTQDATVYDTGTGWSQLADSAGFAVLAAEQTRENNVNGCFNWFHPADTARGEGEAASIRQMIEFARTAYDLDLKRIFITGLSAGGAMAVAMLGAYPELFAAGAVIAGLPIGSAANVPEALHSMRHAAERPPQEWGRRARGKSAHGAWPRISIWHGDADTTVDISNADALIAQWTDLQGVGIVPSSDQKVAGHRHRIWRNKDSAPVVEAFTVSGMGHGAPLDAGRGGLGQAGLHFPDAGLSSTARIAAFWGLVAPAQEKAAGAAGPHAHTKLPGMLLSVLQKAGLLKR